MANEKYALEFGDLAQVVDTIFNNVNNWNEVKDNSKTSLFSYAKKAIIGSGVYIEDTLAGEEILNPLLKSLMNQYASIIQVVLQLNQFVDKTTHIKDIMGIVASESYHDHILKELPKSTINACEDFFISNKEHFKLTPRAAKMLDDPLFDQSIKESDATYADQNITPSTIRDKEYEEHEEKVKVLRTRAENEWNDILKGNKNIRRNNGTISSSVSKDDPIPTGKLLNITYSIPSRDGESKTVSFQMYIKFYPRYITPLVASQFVGLNFRPSLKQKWLQMTSGEISFFSDFLFSQHLRRKRMAAIVQDKSGALKNMLDKQENALSKHFLKLANNMSSANWSSSAQHAKIDTNANIANTILIFDKRNFEKACYQAGINWKNAAVREKFFAKTYAMMLCLVDTDFDKVTIFTNGLNDVGEFTRSQLDKNAKSDAAGLMDLMKAYAQGHQPRF